MMVMKMMYNTIAFIEKEELREAEEPMSVLQKHLDSIVKAIREAKHVVVYTGAGISTSADIPGKFFCYCHYHRHHHHHHNHFLLFLNNKDYRGPQGAWTVRDRGVLRTKAKSSLTDAK